MFDELINWIKYEVMGLPNHEDKYLLTIGDKKGSVSFPVSICVGSYIESHPKAKIILLEIKGGFK